jgi:hypothetical protein
MSTPSLTARRRWAARFALRMRAATCAVSVRAPVRDEMELLFLRQSSSCGCGANEVLCVRFGRASTFHIVCAGCWVPLLGRGVGL